MDTLCNFIEYSTFPKYIYDINARSTLYVFWEMWYFHTMHLITMQLQYNAINYNSVDHDFCHFFFASYFLVKTDLLNNCQIHLTTVTKSGADTLWPAL